MSALGMWKLPHVASSISTMHGLGATVSSDVATLLERIAAEPDGVVYLYASDPDVQVATNNPDRFVISALDPTSNTYTVGAIGQALQLNTAAPTSGAALSSISSSLNNLLSSPNTAVYGLLGLGLIVLIGAMHKR